MAEVLGPDGLFAEAPEPVRRFFRSKRSLPSFSWQDVAPAEHATMFTVAKTAGYDVLEDLRAAVDDAIVNRTPFETFQSQLEPILRAKGWWGRSLVEDPLTGELVDAQLGSPRRLRTIHWANVYSAHAAGEWERIQNTKRVLPFLRYGLTVSKEPREEHAAWFGVILPVDHPWWDTHFPPNGWGCKCPVEQLSRFRAQKLGYDPAKEPPDLGTTSWTNGRTGETVEVPNGIDPGWEGNPGKTRSDSMSALAAGRIERMPPAAQDAAVADLTRSPVGRAVTNGSIPYRPGATDMANRQNGSISVPVAVLPKSVSEAFEAQSPVVRFSVADGYKMRDRHPEIDVEDIARVHRALRDPSTRLIVEAKERNLHLIFDDWHAVIRRTADGAWTFLKTLHRWGNDPGYGERVAKRGKSIE
ncbi:phage head morphogenesis protein [Kaistia sp. MMO-174]|uniref:phage head morphogenesis protein n=1 Tax=Kaistia sp. MMO-174 TaxID=3081256 RepID=UPI0030165799